jgi:murein DD-endopeptidase MepM/ murein hydrolase activator NlpD
LRRRAFAAASLALALGLLAACASTPPPSEPGWGVHVVRRGETLWRISQAYGTTVDAIARANQIGDATKIWPGQRLRIPLDGRGAPQRSAAAWTSSDPRGKSGKIRFEWPVQGRMSSRYGFRDGAHHDGIDIRTPRGTAFRAAEAGRVIHSDDSLRGYGNMIIIKHSGVFTTVYAHNRVNHVKVGDFVERGQVIGEVGSTGRAQAPHLHFEIRRNGDPKDPLEFLP